jgi:hypothetical protein
MPGLAGWALAPTDARGPSSGVHRSETGSIVRHWSLAGRSNKWSTRCMAKDERWADHEVKVERQNEVSTWSLIWRRAPFPDTTTVRGDSLTLRGEPQTRALMHRGLATYDTILRLQLYPSARRGPPRPARISPPTPRPTRMRPTRMHPLGAMRRRCRAFGTTPTTSRGILSSQLSKK